MGVGACASEILGVRQPSNNYSLTAISGKHYFHQSNFCFTEHNFHPEKMYLIRIFALIHLLFPLKKDYFHQNNNFEIIHCVLSNGECSFHLNYITVFSLISLPPTLYRSGWLPNVTYPKGEDWPCILVCSA